MKPVAQTEELVCNYCSLCAVPGTAGCANGRAREGRWARKASVSKNLGVFFSRDANCQNNGERIPQLLLFKNVYERKYL